MSVSARAKGILEIASTVSVLVSALALLWTIYSRQADPAGPNGGPRLVEDTTGLSIAGASITKRLGSGPIALVEFSDFQCPYCGKFARDTYPLLRRHFVDTGRLSLVAFAFPLDKIHPLARKAGEAAECAGRQGKFWEMHDQLFADQTDLASGALSDAARALNLDMLRYEACLAGEAEAAVDADIGLGRGLKVNGTPTLFVGRFKSDGSLELIKRINGAAPFAEVESAINEVTKRG